MKSLKRIGKIVIYSVITIIGIELGMWVLGYRPYQNHDYKIAASPKNPFIGDDSLGFALNPGIYEITLNDSLTFTTTHLPEGIRKTSFQLDSISNQTHFFGCSFTYGYGVNDEQTFCSQLQKQISSSNIVNHGVMGYGTVQSYLQLQNTNLKANDQVVLCFSSHHLMRNTLSQKYRSHLKIGFENSSADLDKKMNGSNFPYLLKCNEPIQFAAWNQLYSNYYGRETFALINYIQTNIDIYAEDMNQQIESSICLIQKMAEICNQIKIPFTVVCLDKTSDTEKIRQGLGQINWVDLNFNFNDKELTNYPYDSHPNKKGAELIAVKLKSALFPENN